MLYTGWFECSLSMLSPIFSFNNEFLKFRFLVYPYVYEHTCEYFRLFRFLYHLRSVLWRFKLFIFKWESPFFPWTVKRIPPGDFLSLSNTQATKDFELVLAKYTNWYNGAISILNSDFNLSTCHQVYLKSNFPYFNFFYFNFSKN